MPCTFNFLLLIQKNNSKKKQKNKTYVLNKSRLMEQALIFDIYCNWGGGGVEVWGCTPYDGLYEVTNGGTQFSVDY